MRIAGLFLIASGLALSPADAAILNVPRDYPTIAAAVDSAAPGDEVVLATGTYSGPGNRDIELDVQDITVRSVDPLDPSVVASTIIDAQGSFETQHRCFLITTPGIAPTIAGLTLVNGYAHRGAAVYVTAGSPHIEHCVIRNHQINSSGGAVYSNSANPVITGCLFADNWAPSEGGAVYCVYGSVSIRDSLFMNNTADDGGALWIGAATGDISRCIMNGNTGSDHGGALTIINSPIVVSNCVIAGNTGGEGGGLSCRASANPTINLCTIAHNTATISAGALALEGSGGATSLLNSILWGNSAPEGPHQIDVHLNSLLVRHSLVQGGEAAVTGQNLSLLTWAEGNIDSDPLLGDPTWLNFNLRIGSPAVDAGDLDYVPLPGETDAQGDPRVLDGNDDGIARVDMGADELNSDCNDNGALDSSDIAKGTSLDCNGSGVPDECEDLEFIDCNENGILDLCDIFDGSALDCDANRVPDECQPDCDANGTPDVCDVQSGEATDCDGDGVLDTCDPDCNDNGTSDHCDILAATSDDCDGDIVPDECQDTSADCNDNAVWDGCDIAIGDSSDRDVNGVPDECQQNTIRYVDDDALGDPGPGTPLCSDPFEDGSPPHPFDAIQEAIDLSISGDTVLVADGIYAGPGNYDLDYGGRLIVVRSVNGPTTCTIDAQGAGRGVCFNGGESNEAVIDGFTITGGSVRTNGGGIDCEDSSPTIQNCVLTGNHAGQSGGAIRLRNSNAIVRDCIVTSNSADSMGGGIRVSSSAPTIERCAIGDNQAISGGGGVDLYSSGGTVRHSLIHNNQGGSLGGGINAWNDSECTILGCTIADNTSTGEGAGLTISESGLTIRSTILWGPGAQRSGWSNTMYSNIKGGISGVGNIDVDPLFVSASDFRLQATSPCINAGDPAFVAEAEETDLDGDARVRHCRIDMGASETSFFIDCNEDLDSDACEIVDGADDCDTNYVPDECDPDCDSNGAVDACDLAHGLVPDCNFNARPDECDIVMGDSLDCNANLVPDECEVSAGIGDCNDNSVPDVCDVDTGSSSDCNDNGVPDECEIDCNLNGIIDVCEVPRTDCNGNGISDACEVSGNALWLADFDNGLPATWTADGLWHSTGDCVPDDGCAAGPVAYFGMDVGCTYDTGRIIHGLMSTAPFFIPQDATTVELIYCTYYEGECGDSPKGFDAAWVSVDGTEVDDVSGDDDCDEFPTVWHTRHVDLTPYVGQYVVLAWHFDSVDAVDNLHLGWVVDDVRLLMTPALDVADCNGNEIPDECEVESLDCNGNALIDSCEIEDRLASDCDDNGIPDECDNEDCNNNGLIDTCEIQAGTADDCDISGVPDECEDLDDCNLNGTADACEISNDPFVDCDNSGVPDECEDLDDCNLNGTADACEVSNDPSLDCDDSGIPDECEILPDCDRNGVLDACDIADQAVPDCNTNSIPDSCDIAQGTSPDNNKNGIPDECDTQCTHFSDCADLDSNGIRDDNCVWWACINDTCVDTDIVFADMGGQFGACEVDGAADGNDRFAALNCFANQNADGSSPFACENDAPNALNVDAGGSFGSCTPDGVCDGNDAFAALNAFGGATACTCPPAPVPAVEPRVIGNARLELRSNQRTMQPGDTVDVDVYLATPLEDLRGYQLHLGVHGGDRGGLSLIDISVDRRPNAAFQQSDWAAFNIDAHQMVAGLDSAGMPIRNHAYLATFTYRAAHRAAGAFTIDVLHDAADSRLRTFLFASDATAIIKITADPIIVEVAGQAVHGEVPGKRNALR